MKFGPAREANYDYWETHEEKGGTSIRASSPVNVPRQQDSTKRSSRGWHEFLQLSWALEEDTGFLF